MAKPSLDNRENIHALVTRFYGRVQQDDLLGDIFNNAAHFSWETHIPVMIDFWSSLLLGTMSYKGNVMAKHLELNRSIPLQPRHFDRWKALFYAALDEFEGPEVLEARRRVEAMSGLMQYKISQSGKKGFIQ